MGQSTSLDFLARISCHHFSLWMHCLLVTKKCDTWLGRGVSVELVAIDSLRRLHVLMIGMPHEISILKHLLQPALPALPLVEDLSYENCTATIRWHL